MLKGLSLIWGFSFFAFQLYSIMKGVDNMTLWELYCDRDLRKTINWNKCAEKILILETANRIELIDARGIVKRYRLMCRRAQILSAKAFVYEQMLNTSISQQLEMMLRMIGSIRKTQREGGVICFSFSHNDILL